MKNTISDDEWFEFQSLYNSTIPTEAFICNSQFEIKNEDCIKFLNLKKLSLSIMDRLIQSNCGGELYEYEEEEVL